MYGWLAVKRGTGNSQPPPALPLYRQLVDRRPWCQFTCAHVFDVPVVIPRKDTSSVLRYTLNHSLIAPSTSRQLMWFMWYVICDLSGPQSTSKLFNSTAKAENILTRNGSGDHQEKAEQRREKPPRYHQQGDKTRKRACPPGFSYCIHQRNVI
jgi:hypothetical protein